MYTAPQPQKREIKKEKMVEPVVVVHEAYEVETMPAHIGTKICFTFLIDLLVNKFDTTKDGKVMWFSAPPIQVLNQTVSHSRQYLLWKHAKGPVVVPI